MDAQITLTTSDDPPVSLTISRSALVAQSKVFADMLSLDLKSDNSDASIPISETEKELKPFITILNGQDDERNAALEKSDSVGWTSLARLADKYDCWSIQRAVEAKAWECHSSKDNVYETALAFALAVTTTNTRLIRLTAEQAVTLSSLDPYDMIPAFWKNRLMEWRTQHTADILNNLHHWARRAPGHSQKRCRGESACKGETVAALILGEALVHFDITSTPPLRLRGPLNSVPLCDNYKWQIERHFETVEHAISSWGEFKVGK